MAQAAAGGGGGARGPLAGIRVLDLTTVVAGPMVGQMLCDMGADVIKLETMAYPGDGYRHAGSFKMMNHGTTGIEVMGGCYYTVNRGKRCIAVDMKKPAGYELFTRLLRRADVLTMNMRPQAAQRLGVSYEQCRAINPDLVYLASTGWGPDGPFSASKAYDPVIQATAGVIAAQARSTRQGGPDTATVNSIVMDKTTAMASVQAVLAALLVRERGGGGQKVDISMLDAGLAFNWPDVFADKVFLEQETQYRRCQGTVPEMFGTARTSDGRHVICVTGEAELFGKAFDRPDLLQHLREGNFVTVRDEMIKEMAKYSLDDVMARLEKWDMCGVVVPETVEEVLAHPQVQHNQIAAAMEDPNFGPVRLARPAARFSATPQGIQGRAPLHGEHTREVLREAGYSDAEVDQLAKGQVVNLGGGMALPPKPQNPPKSKL